MNINVNANSGLYTSGMSNPFFRKQEKPNNALINAVNKAVDSNITKDIEKSVLEKATVIKQFERSDTLVRETKKSQENQSDMPFIKATASFDLSLVSEDLREVFQNLTEGWLEGFSVQLGEETKTWEEDNVIHVSIREEDIRSWWIQSHPTNRIENQTQEQERESRGKMMYFFTNLRVVGDQLKADARSILDPQYNHWDEVNNKTINDMSTFFYDSSYNKNLYEASVVNEEGGVAISAKWYDSKYFKDWEENELNKLPSSDTSSDSLYNRMDNQKNQELSYLTGLYKNNLTLFNFAMIEESQSVNKCI